MNAIKIAFFFVLLWLLSGGLPEGAVAQERTTVGFGVGFLRLDVATPALERREIFVGEGRGKSWYATATRRVDHLGQVEFSYGFASPDQTVIQFFRDGNGDIIPRGSGPAYKTPLNVHLMRLQLLRRVVSVRGIHLSLRAGGGLIYVDPGQNETIPGFDGMTPDVKEFDSLLDPVVTFGARVAVPLQDHLAVTVDVGDNVHLCENGSFRDEESQYYYMCTLQSVLHHYEMQAGIQLRW